MAYHTKQLDAVKQCLQNHGEQLISAAQIREDLRAMDCPVGMATIYRQLERLEQQGQVHKLAGDEGAVYQYCPNCHHESCALLHCQGCGRMLHLDCHDVEAMYSHLESHHHFHINRQKTLLTGLCQFCWEKEQS